MPSGSQKDILKAIREDGRYPPVAYDFLHQGLEEATRGAVGAAPPGEPRHVSGQDLCEALRKLALQRWGVMAPVVLSHWNIRRTRDFGEMVFFLINLNLMGKQESDHIEDFDDVYDFAVAFDSSRLPLDDSAE